MGTDTYIHGKQLKKIGLRKTFIYIGDTKVKFYNDRKTYKEYLADRFNPNINGGADFNLACKNHRFNRDAEKSKIEFPVICSVERYRVREPYYSIVYQTWRIFYLEATTEKSYLQLKKIHKPKLPADYKFPKHLGRNDDLYKDLKEYHPDESRREKRLRIRSYAKKRREENRIYYTKKISSIIARITSLLRKLIKLTLYVIRKLFELTLYVIRKLFELALYVIKRPIVLTFENILYAIKTNSAHELVFKLLLFPFFLVNHISATGKLPTFTEIKESERYYYLAFRGLVRTVVYITLFAAIIYYVVSA